MAENTKIEWTDHTFNPWIGCTKVGPGCDHCYAENLMDTRLGIAAWGAGKERVRTKPSNWNMPLRWNAQADAFMAQHGRRQRVFCASLADVFDNAVPLQWREDLFALIAATPNLDWLLLTKRIGNVPGMISIIPGHLPPNVWLGITVVNQIEADRDIPKLLDVPARVRFLSMEPLLGPVDLTRIPVSGTGNHEFDPIITANILKRAEAYPSLPQVNWVIVGGESGRNARPMHPDWARSLRDQCEAAGVPFLFKQWGEWMPRGPASMGYPLVDGVPRIRITDLGEDGSDLSADGGNHVWMQRAGKKATGRLLDGRTWDNFPTA